MCGIAGIWRRDGKPVERAELDAVTDAMAHRGPDGRGVWIDASGSLGLGHRRLSILDLTDQGRQPMAFCGRHHLVYNGEVYNFIELRRELRGLGHVFHTDTDTEVVAAAYAQWGADCLERFNGMWGLAVWDDLEKTLFLARDRFGIKPLYYAYDGRNLAFASELKAFLHLPWIDASLDAKALGAEANNPIALEGGARTYLRGVSRLEAGHFLLLQASGGLTNVRWWNTLDRLERTPRGEAAQVEEFRALFLDACRLRLRSDAVVGAALSGGLDSGAVLCMMAHAMRLDQGGDRLQRDWQRAFVGVYAGTPQDEEPQARMVVDSIGGRGVYVKLDPADANLDEIIFQMEDVYYETPVGPWLVYRAMREQGVRVSLDGHGGDEVLGGYHHHALIAMRQALRGPNPLEFLRLRRLLAGMSPPQRRSPLPSLARLWRLDLERGWPGLSAHYDQDLPRLGQLDPVTRALYVDTHCLTLPSILRNFDRLSMGHGVEVRTPLLDWRLVCMAMSLPGRSKVGGGMTKRILRRAMGGLMPDAVRLARLKLGFGTPKQEWLSGPLAPWVRDTAASRAFREAASFDGRAVSRRIEGCYERRDWNGLAVLEQYLMASRLEALMVPQRFAARPPEMAAAPASAPTRAAQDRHNETRTDS